MSRDTQTTKAPRSHLGPESLAPVGAQQPPPPALTGSRPPAVRPAHEHPWGGAGGAGAQALHLLLGSGSRSNREGASPSPGHGLPLRKHWAPMCPPHHVPVRGTRETGRQPGKRKPDRRSPGVQSPRLAIREGLSEEVMLDGDQNDQQEPAKMGARVARSGQSSPDAAAGKVARSSGHGGPRGWPYCLDQDTRESRGGPQADQDLLGDDELRLTRCVRCPGHKVSVFLTKRVRVAVFPNPEMWGV